MNDQHRLAFTERLLVMTVSGLAVLVLVTGSTGCETKKPEAKVAPSTPALSPFDIPVAPRHEHRAAPAGALSLELNGHGLRIDGKPALTAGKGSLEQVASVAHAAALLKKAALQKPSTTVALRSSAVTSYATLTWLLAALYEANLRDVYLATRSKGAPATRTAWFKLPRFSVVPKRSKLVDFDGMAPLSWDDFVEAWPEVYRRCREASHECAPKPETVARGGELEIAIQLLGETARFQFTQLDPPPKPKYQRVQTMNFGEGGDAPNVVNVEIPQGPPPRRGIRAAQAAFDVRASRDALTMETLPRLLDPVCSERPCVLRFVADGPAQLHAVLAVLVFGTQRDPAVTAIAFERST